MFDIDLSAVLKANQLLLADAEDRLAKVAEREATLRSHLESCETERREIAREKEAIELADRLYRRRFVPHDDDDVVPIKVAAFGESALEKKPRARVGDQRYRILARLREWGGYADLDEISNATSLSAKRIRDQFRSDVPDGIVLERDGRYAISPAGLDLLDRFERYKTAKGEDFPALDGPPGDEEGDNPSSDTELAEQEENAAA